MANGAEVATDEDEATDITLNGSDFDGDTVDYLVTSGPNHGSLSGTAPNLTYIPDANYHGEDSFTFKVNDGEIDSNEATISIAVDSVNDPPSAENDSPATDEDVPLQLTLLATDIDGDSLSYAIVDSPAHAGEENPIARAIIRRVEEHPRCNAKTQNRQAANQMTSC